MDEFGGLSTRFPSRYLSANLHTDFDAADFSSPHDESHPDEVILPAIENSHNVRGIAPPQQNTNPSGKQSNGTKPQTMQAPARPNNALQAFNGTNGSNEHNIPPQPQTPNAGLSRSLSGAGDHSRAAQETTDTGHVKKEPPKFFVVGLGHIPGIYDTWAEANKQTVGFPGGECKFKCLHCQSF